MLIPEQLFRLPLLKDAATQQIELISRFVTVAGSTVDTIIYAVPPDRVGVVAGLTFFDQLPATAFSYIRFASFTQPGNQYQDIASWSNVSPPTTVSPWPSRSFNWSGQVWIGPGAAVSFDGFALSGSIVGRATVHLLTMPRGNVTRG